MRVLLDTGPLVALCNDTDQYHRWAEEEMARLQTPVVTCEAVLTEAHHLLAHDFHGIARLMGLIESGMMEVAFAYLPSAKVIHDRMRRYADLPMDFADACLVQMAEEVPSEVLTTDADFLIYRIHRSEAIPVRMPAR